MYIYIHIYNYIYIYVCTVYIMCIYKICMYVYNVMYLEVVQEFGIKSSQVDILPSIKHAGKFPHLR